MTALPRPFRWEGGHIAIDLRGGAALFTTRRGGVSEGPYASLNLGPWTDDDPGHVAENRGRAAAVAGVTGERLAQGHQVHGTAVARLSEAPEPGAEPADRDGQAVSAPDVGAIVLVADCLPVAIAGDGAVAAVHCGWRGLAGGIVAEAVAALRELGATGPLEAAIGPGAGGCCYEVGEEVLAAFAAHGPDVHDGRLLDLPAIARRELAAAGVETVHDVALCTLHDDPDLFFSHRRDGGVTGRQAAIVRRA